MKSIKQFNISLIIRGIIIPFILLATIVGGYILNQKMISLIDFGFTAKLSTLSSTAGAFIRLEDHQKLIELRSFTKIRRGFDESWFVLSPDGTVHEIFSDGSVTLEPVIHFQNETGSLSSFTVLNENLYSVDSLGVVIKWNSGGSILRQIDLDLKMDATIASNVSRKELIIGPDLNDNLIILDENLNRLSSFESPSASVLDFNVDTDGNLVILTESQELIMVDLNSGETNSTTQISCEVDENCVEFHSLAPIDNRQIWGLSQTLSLISTDGTIDPDFNLIDGFHDHTTDRYLRYVIPMREIKVKQDLTFLYSFVLNDSDKTISYVLDSSVDDSFTPIGYTEDVFTNEDFVAATNVQLTGNAHVSEIKPWGQWGLAKIAFGPIYSPEGVGAAIMGADQNVSSIDQVSREALVILALSSFVFLLFGATASWYIAKSLTTPLLILKENVLGIAAGFFDRPVVEPALKDLRPLAAVFIEAGDNLKKEVIQGPQILKKFEQLRLEQDFMTYLELKLRDTSRLPVEIEISPNHRKNMSWLSDSDVVLIWHVDSKNNSDYELVKTHNTIYQTAKGLLKSNQGLKPVVSNLHAFFKTEMDFIVVYDTKSGSFIVATSEFFHIAGIETISSGSTLSELSANELSLVTQDGTSVISISQRSNS